METLEVRALKAIQVQTLDFCNRACKFCPNVPLNRSMQLMEEELYRALLQSLADGRFSGRFSPYLMNEPMADPRLAHMISIARKYLPSNTIAINTNGDYLRKPIPEVESLRNAGLDLLLINIYDNQQRFDVLSEELTGLSGVTFHPAVPILGSFERNGEFHIRLRLVKEIPQHFWNRGGNVSFVSRADEHRKPLPCSLIGSQAYVLHDGRFVLCCSDWGSAVVLGKFPENSIEEILNGVTYADYRKAHENKSIMGLELCKTCDRVRSF